MYVVKNAPEIPQDVYIRHKICLKMCTRKIGVFKKVFFVGY